MVEFVTVVAQADGGGGVGCLGSMIPLILIFLIFWFIVIRPEQKKQEEHQEFLDALKVGDRVVTAGGIFGEVKAVDDDTVKLQINRDNRIEVLRQQIKGPQEEYLGGDEDDETDDSDDSDDGDDGDDSDDETW